MSNRPMLIYLICHVYYHNAWMTTTVGRGRGRREKINKNKIAIKCCVKNCLAKFQNFLIKSFSPLSSSPIWQTKHRPRSSHRKPGLRAGKITHFVHRQKLLNKYSNGIHHRFNFFRALVPRCYRQPVLTTSNFLIRKILNCTRTTHTDRQRDSRHTIRSPGIIPDNNNYFNNQPTRYAHFKRFLLYECVGAVQMHASAFNFRCRRMAANERTNKKTHFDINNSVAHVVLHMFCVCSTQCARSSSGAVRKQRMKKR